MSNEFSPQQHLSKINLIYLAMLSSNLPLEFIDKMLDLVLSHKNEGVYHLMMMWYEEEDDIEKNLTIEAIQELIKDHKYV